MNFRRRKINIIFFLLCFQYFNIFSQDRTGVWLGSGSVWSTDVCNTKVTTSVSDLKNGASVSFSQQVIGCNMTNTYSSNLVVNQPALGAYLDYNDANGGIGVLTFSFSREVENPIIHIDKLGGYFFGGSNSVLLRLLDLNLTFSKLSGNDAHFEVTSRTITRTRGQSSSIVECGTSNIGSAAGSVQVNGVFDEVSFQFELNGTGGIGDLIEVIWELSSCDFDLDGIQDSDDLDDDNDGILDTEELNGNPFLDTDNDGLIDSFDRDSDGDGCFDVIEAGFEDPDANGTLGGLPDEVDSDGLIINEIAGYTIPLDVDSNTVFDFQEAAIQPIVLTQPNSNYTLCEQGNLLISISISNSVSIQWQVSTDSGTTWTDLTNSNMYSGVYTTNLELLSMPLSFNSNLYRAKLDEYCNSHIFSDEVLLNILKIPDTGQDGNVIFCTSDTPEDLINHLGGSPDINGIWTPQLTSGTGVFDPSIDLEGVYTYSIDNGYCDISTSSVTVGIPLVNVQPENNYTVCENENLIIPVSVTGSFVIQWQVSDDFGTTWIDLIEDSIYSGVNSENLNLSGIPLSFNTYWFRAKDQLCTPSIFTEVVEIIVLSEPYSGIDGNIIFCPNDTPEDLINYLGGFPDINGIWTPELISGTGMFDPKIDKEGIYSYKVDNGYCFDESTVSVRFSSEPIINGIDIIDNSNNNNIAIIVNGIGDYEYSLDDINYQDENLFNNLKPGIYTVYVNDKNGCGKIETEVDVLGYPKFFTPNNDNINDFWNIRGGENTIYTINIYDRYGKLLKSFDNSSLGWNGKFNNKDMPSSDYWFDFITSEGRKIMGHFALKR